MTSSLVGSEMCIRDSKRTPAPASCCAKPAGYEKGEGKSGEKRGGLEPVSYTHLTLPTICSV
eukprot:2989976-Prorocentrum_lima.AAC.1